jgi:uncharacterized membrane protein (DUF485 family)
MGLLGTVSAPGFRQNETVCLDQTTSKGIETIMNFITWIFRRIKDSMVDNQFEWVKDYRRMILQEKTLSMVLTLVFGSLYIIFVGWLLIPFIDRTDTFRMAIWGLAGSVILFYVYHWLMALHEVYLLERQKTWDALSRR